MSTTKAPKRRRTRRTSEAVLIYLILLAVGATMVVPLVWMVSTSLKTADQLFVYPPHWIPDPATTQNYGDVWSALPFARGFVNSVIVAVLIVAGQVITCSLAAYGFARLRFPLRDQLFLGYLATLMIPSAVTMIPVFIMLKMLPDGINTLFHTHLMSGDVYFLKHYAGKLIGIDSYFALIAPGCFPAYGTFLLRQFFISVPSELEEAAKIDGCTRFGIFRSIMLPLSKPALATLVTFTFLGAWRNFMWPLVVTSSMEMRTLPVMLQAFQSQFYTEWSMLMAASVIALVPAVVIFVACQRYFVAGIQLGAVKG